MVFTQEPPDGQSAPVTQSTEPEQLALQDADIMSPQHVVPVVCCPDSFAVAYVTGP